MSLFTQLLQHLQRKPCLVTQNTVHTLFSFISIASNLRDDMILTQPSTISSSIPPCILSPVFRIFLAAACSLSEDEVSSSWELFKDIIWEGGLSNINSKEVWEEYGRRRGFAQHLLYPPTHVCTNAACNRSKKGLLLKKAEQRSVVLMTLAEGPCQAKSVHLYCEACKTDYRHNYRVVAGERFYYDEQPQNVQVADHVILELSVVELFKTAMDVSWTSATNCARLYNFSLSGGKEAPMGYPIKFELTQEHVWDAFVITSLLDDCKCRKKTLPVPHTGAQRDRFTAATVARNRRIRLYGFEESRLHLCCRCTHFYENEEGHETQKVSVIVIDGVTVGHPCCAMKNCYIPLEKNHHRFCPTHSTYEKECSILGCKSPVVQGSCTCSDPNHSRIEECYILRGQSRFQLQDWLARARIAHLDDAVARDVDISELGDQVNMEEEYEFDEDGGRVLPATNGKSAPAGSSSDPDQRPRSRRHKVKAMFGCRRTHNEQLMVAPCGLIIARQTFFGAEGVASVVDFIKMVYDNAHAVCPDHIFFDNNCTLANMVKNDPFFDNIGLSVDVFHFNCKHSETDTFCQENCNPAAFPELIGDNGKAWRFNSSVAEQTNGWFGGYHSICQEMLVHKYNFFLDELILRRNRRTLEKLERDGQRPRVWKRIP
ncbi:hypothetical protein PAXINDRAFT_90571 [Paxillus involutus ATCC 200175]|uniref:Unplaced genomic scaffold PAXINscaffold_602, whole genome shotgun sequence n=1 Tax=Paxillus involutus ATCC 200175 TaxID=664439 RepID=A0A0C9T853_PAXIN|nr:hypothetical protein PAXINDRAFT_90571 [Paxillus involutus ATCC 200175]